MLAALAGVAAVTSLVLGPACSTFGDAVTEDAGPGDGGPGDGGPGGIAVAHLRP
jgi:hypothetical protein